MARRQVSFIITARNKGFIKAIQQSQRRLARFGRKMERTGRTLTRTISVPVALAGGAAIKMASDFESSMTRIETLVGLGREQVQGMRKDVLRLAGETAQAPHDLSEALFAVTSAGLRGSDAMETLEMSAKASAIGLGETRDIARALTGVLQSYSKQGLTAAEATDTLIGVVREGNLEASELAPVLGRVTGIASQLGISFSEVGASIASFTRLGVSAEEAVTGLRGIMNALLKQTPKAERALAQVGLTFDEVNRSIREDGLAQTLVSLVQSFEGNEKALASFAGRVRGLAAIMGTAGAQSESYLQIARNIEDSTGNLYEGFQRVSETTEFQFNKALANLKTTAIELGSTLLPIVRDIIEVVDEWVTSFSELDKRTQQNIVRTAGFAAALGPLLIVGGKAIKMIAGLNKVIVKLAVALKTGTALMWGYIGAIAALGIANFKANQRSQDRIDAISEEVKKLDTYHKATMRIAKIERERTKIQKQMAKGARGLGKRLEDLNQELQETIDWRDYLALQAAEKATQDVEKNTEKVKKAVQSVSEMSFSIDIGTTGGVETPNVEPGAMFGLTTSVADTYVSNIERMRAASTGFASVTEAALVNTKSAWDNFKEAFKEAGHQASLTSEAVTLAFQSMADKSITSLKSLLAVVVNTARKIISAEIAKGIAAAVRGALTNVPFPFNIAAAASAGAAAAALFNTIVPSISVDDALIRSDGSVVRFHPDDDILAMKDFGNLQPAMSGSQVIKNELFLDGNTVWNNQRRVNTNKRR